MNRRDLLKKSLLSLGALALVNLASAVNALASVAVKALPGKLGYREESRFPQKRCDNCKSYNAQSSECVLQAMRNAMKAQQVLVEKAGHCNMWAKIS